jgi:hypothetical protein
VSFGGIAGLFLGFSLLSGVEIIYYFTMRTGCMMYKNRVSEQLLNETCKRIKFFLLILLSFRQAELYVVQEQEKLLSVAQYDLGLKPKLKKSDKVKSLSMPNVQTVKPVESAGSTKTIQVKAFDSPKVPHKKKIDDQIYTVDGGMQDFVALATRLQRLGVKEIGRKKVRISFVCFLLFYLSLDEIKTQLITISIF